MLASARPAEIPHNPNSQGRILYPPAREALYEKEIVCPVPYPRYTFRLRICTIGKHSRSTCPNSNACAHRSTNPGADSHTVSDTRADDGRIR